MVELYRNVRGFWFQVKPWTLQVAPSGAVTMCSLLSCSMPVTSEEYYNLVDGFLNMTYCPMVSKFTVAFLWFLILRCMTSAHEWLVCACPSFILTAEDFGKLDLACDPHKHFIGDCWCISIQHHR